MVSAAYKNRTRDEIIAAFRESIRRKHEWQKRAEEEIEKIRQERLQLVGCLAIPQKRKRSKLLTFSSCVYPNLNNKLKNNTNMKTKFFFFLAMLLMSSMGAFAQSETKTPLKGDVNEDGVVDAADVVEVVNIIMKKDVDPNKFYWYIGTDLPTSISNLQTDNTKPGWHEIGSSLSGFILDTNNNPVHISETRVPYYVVIPNGLNIYDSLGDLMYYVFDGPNDGIICNINGYKAYKWSAEKDGSGATGVRDVTGVILKEDPNYKWYWYAGEGPINASTTPGSGSGWTEITGTPSSINTGDLANSTKINWTLAVPTSLGLNHVSNGEDVTDLYTVSTVTCADGVSYKVFKQIEPSKRIDISFIK